MTFTNKQRVFIAEYTRDFNAARAAIAAGYSPKTARAIGSKLLTNVDVSAAIKSKIDEICMSADEVKTRLADIARGDITDLMDVTSMGFSIELLDENGNRKPQTKLIKKIRQKVTTYQAKSESQEDREVIETEIELYSAHDALRDIGKMHALFTDKVDVTTKGEKLLPDESYSRALSKLADAIGEIVPGASTEQNSAMGSAE
jgi:phage terminase small subunit